MALVIQADVTEEWVKEEGAQLACDLCGKRFTVGEQIIATLIQDRTEDPTRRVYRYHEHCYLTPSEPVQWVTGPVKWMGQYGYRRPLEPYDQDGRREERPTPTLVQLIAWACFLYTIWSLIGRAF